MRIDSITLSGFRCFGPDPITVPISLEITAVVGPNAAGKIALLHALSKLFTLALGAIAATVEKASEDLFQTRENDQAFIQMVREARRPGKNTISSSRRTVAGNRTATDSRPAT